MVGLQVDDRSLAMAQAIFHQITQLLAPGCMPLFLSDGNPNYLPAIVSHFGHWVQLPRRHNRGSWPKPRWMRLADQYRDGGAAQSQPAPAGGGDSATQRHFMQE